jgi:4-amino-4-deoxy-L-arabinose transferase-like glycosyltransferase
MPATATDAAQDTQRKPKPRLGNLAALFLLGAGFTLVHVLVSRRYGFHRDELLSYSNALDPQWGYVVYPPVTAALARIELAAFGTSLVGFRFFAAVASGATAVLTGLIARELGGKRRAMLVAAVAISIGGSIMFAGSFHSYMSFDLLWWVLAAWGVARILRTGNARWWILVGAALGAGLMTKYTVAFFAFGILAGMLLTPARRHLRSGWFWCGVALALAIFLPNILWQVQHHFVALDWMKSIHARDVQMGRADNFLLNQLWKNANPVTLPLWIAGLWFLFVTPQGRPWRMLGWMYVIPLVAFALVRGRDYYLAPAYAMLLAAGAVWGENWLASLNPDAQRRIVRSTWRTLAGAGIFTACMTLPLAPVDSRWWHIAEATHHNFNMELGWPELAATVARVRDSLPANEQNALGILAGDEGAAGAINLYGRNYGLPRAINGMNSNWLRGYGDPPPLNIIAVDMDILFLEKNFASCRWVAKLDKPHGITNDTIGRYYDIYVCGPPLKGWPEFWKDFQIYG